MPANCRFGGVLTDVVKQLSQLLGDKGVPEDQVKSRADMIIDRLGRSRVLQLLRSGQAWRDLKAACNSQSPIIQLVLPGELQSHVNKRLADGKPFGSKKTKRQFAQKQTDTAVKVSPNDISVPDGIFKEGKDMSLSQIRVSDIGPQSRGVVLLTAQEAAPYLKVSQAVSCNGLALLILDHASPLLVGAGDQVRFPALCKQTSEPLILSACMVQLGGQPVSRNLLPEAPKIDEVPNMVVKVIIFRDELEDLQWSEFCTQPVTYIKEWTPALQGAEAILDCWDRQFLTLKMLKSKPGVADLFSVSFRLTGVDLIDLLQESGTRARYFEPRGIDGRSHDPAFKIVWLNKQDKPTACVSKQSTKEWSCLVRSGTRFGLRVKEAQASVVHAQHKPNQTYLEGTQLQSFLVGPMPFGATRATITKVFRTWTWSAKPTQPRGKSVDGRGILWEVVASGPPPYEVYQMQHSDILISALPKKSTRPEGDHNAVQGSARTLAALRAANTDTVAQGDPWEDKSQDPWAGWTPSKQLKQSTTHKADQVEVMATSIEKRIMNSLQPKLDTLTMPDAVMQDDGRVQALEDRMSQLELTVAANHSSQQQHNTEVAVQLTTMKQAVDAQGQSLQSHFDRKLEEQLSHIERILSAKKPRTD